MDQNQLETVPPNGKIQDKNAVICSVLSFHQINQNEGDKF